MPNFGNAPCTKPAVADIFISDSRADMFAASRICNKHCPAELAEACLDRALELEVTETGAPAPAGWRSSVYGGEWPTARERLARLRYENVTSPTTEAVSSQARFVA